MEESNKLRACKAGSNEGYQMGHNSLLRKSFRTPILMNAGKERK
jgi:hypothetical protein